MKSILFSLLITATSYAAVSPVKCEIITESSTSLGGEWIPSVTNTYYRSADSSFFRSRLVATQTNLADFIQSNYSNVNFDCVASGTKSAALVAPDMAIGCAHWHYDVGEEIVFGGCTAIVEAVSFIPDYDGWYNDVSFVKLDRKLPVEHALLAPTNWSDYFDVLAGTPCVVYSKKYGKIEMTLKGHSNNNHGWATPYYVGLHDSGSPCFLVINDRPVLIGTIIGLPAFFACSTTNLMEVDRGWFE